MIFDTIDFELLRLINISRYLPLNLKKNYDVKSLKNKEENKKAILKEFGLEYNPQRPLITMVSRLTEQKGLDLFRDMQHKMQETEADFIFLGTGDKKYEDLLIWLSNNTKNIRSYIGYKAELANLLYAGADFFLMPSKFEPCGLSQMIASRYGSVPVVRATGGLYDTIADYYAKSENQLFIDINPNSMN